MRPLRQRAIAPFSSRAPIRVFRDREVQRLVDELLAGEDRSFALDDHTLPSRRRAGERADIEDTRRRLPGVRGFRTDSGLRRAHHRTAEPTVHDRRARRRRTRDRQRNAEQAQWLAAWIDDPLEGVHLVLVAGGGRTPGALDKASKANAQVVGSGADQTADVLQRELHGPRT